MKTILTTILALALVLTSCDDDDLIIIPSGNITTEEISVTNFNKLDVSNMFEVQVTFSETEESVVVEANENLHEVIEVHEQNGTLYIDLQKNISISGTPVLNVFIKTASLIEVAAEGAAIVTFQNKLVGTRLELELEGASVFNGELELDELYGDLVGASIINISGSSDLFEIDAEGASIMTGFGFETNDFETNLNGASNVTVTVNETLDVTASGASSVVYKGNGEIVHQNISDSSEIIKVD